MSLSVYSEIGPLREVLVHSPGEEVDVMPPSMMQELLFDDIIYGPRARMEHARFCAILEKLGVKVVDTQALLREALERAPEASAQLVDEIARLEGLSDATSSALRGSTAGPSPIVWSPVSVRHRRTANRTSSSSSRPSPTSSSVATPRSCSGTE